MTSNEPGKRARNRARNEQAIIDAAEKLLAEQGTAGLTWRGVAHETGLAPSALYRYVDGLDDLITTLIVRAYREVGAAARAAYDAAGHDDAVAAVVATAKGIRGWALANRHKYALVYGSPIPGYQAPEATIDPATEVGLVLIDAFKLAHDGPEDDGDDGLIDPGLPASLGIPASVTGEAVDLWAHLFGLISFELFGHFNNVIADPDGYFTLRMTETAKRCIAATQGRGGRRGTRAVRSAT